MTYTQKTIGTYVPSEGPTNAKIIVVGESPWVQEALTGRPFAGQSGKKQDLWWQEVGLKRSDLYIMNLYPFQSVSREIESVSTDELVRWMIALHDRIAKLECPAVVVTLGNYATFALTGKGKVRAAVRNSFSVVDANASEAEKKAGITKLRGSVYFYEDRKGRRMKVIPIIHPAAVLQTEKWEKRTIRDWERVATEAHLPASTYLQRKHIVSPSEAQVENFTRLVENGGNQVVMSTDIETWGRQLSCVGFALTRDESITIPTIGRERDVFLPYVRRLCESQAQKVLCGGWYDWYWLAWYRTWLNNYFWDVQLMHHAIDPAESHSLDFLASIYCPSYQFWKDEAKEAEEIIKYAHNLEALWVYNGLDCCYTRELYDLLYVDLQKEGMVEFYFRHYQQMLEPLIRTMLHGFRIDKEAQKLWAKKLAGEMKEIHQELNEAAGFELFAVEEKTELREVEEIERRQLIDPEWFELKEDWPPKAKWVDRDVRVGMIGEGKTYMIGGANAGKMRVKVTKVKKDFSKVQLAKFFHEVLGLPKQYKRRSGKNGKGKSPSLDEAAIRKMTARWPEKIGNYGNLLLAHREKKKERDYLKGAWDKDGRIRCTYKMLTEAGRLASAKNPMGRGYNLQNIKR